MPINHKETWLIQDSSKDWAQSNYNPEKFNENNSQYASDIQAKRNALQKLGDTYKPMYQNQINESMNAFKNAKFKSNYAEDIGNIINALRDRKFEYDLNGDALYNQYKNNYMAQGKQAMQDTAAQAAALSGGFGNSYGVVAGQQQYNAAISQLNDKIPELYQLAMNIYNLEGQDQAQLLSAMQTQDQADYAKFSDDRNALLNQYQMYASEEERNQNQYNQDRAFNQSALDNLRNLAFNVYQQNEQNKYNSANLHFNKASTIDQMNETRKNNALNRILQYDQLNQSEAQFNANLAEQQRQANMDYAYKQAALSASQKDNGGGGNYISSPSSNTDRFVQGWQQKYVGELNTLKKGTKNGVSIVDKQKGKPVKVYSTADFYDVLIGNAHKDGQLTESEASYLYQKFVK